MLNRKSASVRSICLIRVCSRKKQLPSIQPPSVIVLPQKHPLALHCLQNKAQTPFLACHTLTTYFNYPVSFPTVLVSYLLAHPKPHATPSTCFFVPLFLGPACPHLKFHLCSEVWERVDGKGCVLLGQNLEVVSRGGNRIPWPGGTR